MQQEIIRYWSHGPHFQFRDSIIFLTWRLAFTLPQSLLKLFSELSSQPQTKESKWIKNQMEHNNAYLFKKFLEYDHELARYQNPGFSLNEANIAKIVSNSFHYFAGQKYELHAYCIMPNHVHLLLKAMHKSIDEYYHIAEIVQSLKRYTAREINKCLAQEGQVWDRYYFDRVVRNIKNYENVVQYISQNPVNAKLVDTAENWRDSFIDPVFYTKL